jgi:hypothetical protein
LYPWADSAAVARASAAARVAIGAVQRDVIAPPE